MGAEIAERLKFTQKLLASNRAYKLGLWLIYSDIARGREKVEASSMLGDIGVLELLVSSGKAMEEYTEISRISKELGDLFSNNANTISAIINQYRANNNIAERPLEVEVINKFIEGRVQEELDRQKRAKEQLKASTEDTQEEDWDNWEDDDTQQSNSTPQQSTEDTHKEIEIDDWELDSYTNRLMDILGGLYRSAYDVGRPYGIAVSDGYITIDSRTNEIVYKRVKAIKGLMTVISSASPTKIMQKPISNEATLDSIQILGYKNEYNYYPEFQLSILYGFIDGEHKNKWEDMANLLEQRVRATIKQYLVRGYNLDSIINALATSVIIYRYNSAMSLRMTLNIGNGVFSTNKFKAEYERHKLSILAGNGELFGLRSDKNTGVATFDLVFNKQSYFAGPMFAYKAVEMLQEKNQAPSIRNFILGEDADGNTFTTNLCRADASKILIGAGPRSGKGVFTLNLLGTILASGSPLIYLDYKPDMAETLKGICTKYGIKGAIYDGTVSWDAGVNKWDGLPEEVESSSYMELVSALPYLKVVQLMMYASQLSVNGELDVSKRPFFIFDEILSLQSAVIKTKLTMCASYGNDKKNSGMLAEWCKKVSNWIVDLDSSLSGSLVSQMPKSNITTVWLFQSIQPTTWKSYNATVNNKAVNPFLRVIENGTTLKILGRGTFNSSYGLQAFERTDDVKERIENRWFAYSEAQKISNESDIKVFKPYLVLNDYEADKDTVKEFKAALEENKIDVREFVPSRTTGGDLDKRAGLEGFIECIGEGAIQNLSLGYKFLTELMEKSGLASIYGDVDSYLYSGDMDSLYTLSDLIKGVSGERIDKLGGRADTSDNMDSVFDTVARADKGVDIQKSNTIEDNSEDNDILELGSGNAQRLLSDLGEEAYKPNMGIEPMQNTRSNEMNTQSNEISVEDINSIYRKEFMSNPQPSVYKPSANQIATEVNNRVTTVDTQRTRSWVPMTQNNSIDCSGAYEGPSKWFENIYMRGSINKYADGRWSAILDRIEYTIHPNDIKRVYIFNTAMFVNNRLCNLNGVLGGENNILLADIVNYTLLAKRFKHIRELAIDVDTMKSAFIEFGIDSDIIVSLFNINSELLTISVSAGNKVEKISRMEALRGNSGDSSKEVKVNAVMDMQSSADKARGNNKQATENSLYSKRLMEKCGEKTRSSYKNKHLISGTLWGVAAAVTGVFGGAVWGVKKAFGNKSK